VLLSVQRAILKVALVPLVCLGALGQTARYRDVWNDPEVVQRIDDGIRANRMGWATLRFVDEKGQPVTNVQVSVEQTSHQFLFGANLFMLGGFDSAADNRKYEETFLRLFNYGTASFYWKTLEPKPGQLRFAADSAKIFRRPPPDLAVEFARRSGITLKGHPLVWDNPTWQHPDWAPNDPAAMDRLLRVRIEQIAARYREDFRVWDVANEVFHRGAFSKVPMPEDYVFRAFQTAAKVFTVDTKLTLNDDGAMWQSNFSEENSAFYLKLKDLLARGAAVNAIGFQCHFFNEEFYHKAMRGEAVQPLEMLHVLDRYADFRLPVHITEITIPTLPGTSDGEAAQAEMARNLYRLWFSHPSVEAITWWNLVDDTAAPGEDKWRGGLVRRDFSPKPAFEALHKLIAEEWHTRLRSDSGGSAQIKFQGFYGNYTAEIRHNGQSQRVNFTVAKGAHNDVEVKF
jgi:GH35 family endo-1,4-beta-xylanase